MPIILGSTLVDGVSNVAGNSGLTAIPQVTHNASAALSGSGFLVTYMEAAALSGEGTLKGKGSIIAFQDGGPIPISRYVGEAHVPQDIKRRRRQVYDAMRRFGTPVIIKHMWNASDVTKGLAKPSPTFMSAYGQVRNEDPFSYGVGFSSVEESDFEWISPEGELVRSLTKPGSGYEKAPRYRGFGPGYLLYVIQPDVAEDFFKIESSGVLIRLQTAQSQAPWFPEMNDNDLMINVTLDNKGEIVETHERYQLKMTNPVTMRGVDKRGRRREGNIAGGNRYVINQIFEMTLVPENNILYSVDTDR